MREIPMINGGDVAVIDDEDYGLLASYRWSRNSRGYALRGEPKRMVLMHHEILRPTNGFVVDHINRNKLDNRRENLRLVTVQQNNRNRGPLGGVSGFKGVARTSQGKQWRAYIYVDRHQTYLGGFATAIEAARAYNAAALRMFGEHAALNDVGLDAEPVQLVAVLDHQHS